MALSFPSGQHRAPNLLVFYEEAMKKEKKPFYNIQLYDKNNLLNFLLMNVM